MAGMEELGTESDYSSFNVTVMDANDTLTCAARNIQGPVEVSFNPIVPLVVRSLLVIYYMLVAIFGTLLNSFALYLVCRYKKLRTLSFVFVAQIVALDLFGSAVIVTLSLYSALINQWVYGEGVCIGTAVVHTASNVLRNVLLFGLVLDRFCSVFCPYEYPKYQVKFLWCFNTVAYISVAIITVIVGVLDCYSYSFTSFICRIQSTCSPKCAILRQMLGVFVYLSLSISAVVLYSCLFNKGRKARRAMTLTMGTTASASEVYRAKKEWRATITFFLMFLAFFLCIVPPGIVSFIINVTGLTSNSTESLWFYILDSLTLNLFIFTYIATPIFILRNRDVREIIAEINWIPFLKVKPQTNVVLCAVTPRTQ